MATNYITYDNLKISTFELEYLKELKITNSINNHSKLELIGVLPTSIGESDVHSTEEKTPIEVYYVDEKDGKKTLFNGIISNVKVTVNKEVHHLYIEAYSGTYLMDIARKSRSFQDTNMTTHEIIKTVLSVYSNSDVIINIPNKPLGEFFLQYNETDWEFIRRIVSKYNQGLFPEIQAPNLKFFAGLPEDLENQNLEIKNYTISKDMELYEEMKKNYIADASEKDYINYEFESYKVFKLGSKITFKNSPFYISSACYQLKQGVLCNTYKIQCKAGVRQKELFNLNVIGISIDGTIAGVTRDKVQVSLSIDCGKSGPYWFPYATVAASPDGGGWYCMPKIGEKIRLNCPTKDERRAFVINAIEAHKAKEGDKEDRMSNPSNKSLKTDSGQEVKFTPSGILIESSGSQASINLNNDGTITVNGQKNINLACAKKLSLRADNELTIIAQKSVDVLSESGSNFVMSEGDEILLSGTRIHNNG